MSENRHSRLNVRKTHPTMYREVTSVGLIEIALAFNFWYSNPTFNPYGINKVYVGVGFFVLGVTLLVLLNRRSLLSARIVMTASVAITFAWGGGNTQQFFAGNASLQLPILFVGFGVWQIFLVGRLALASTMIGKKL